MVIAELEHGKAPTDVVREVVSRLEQGQVLVLPTDTVYGLHALARNPAVVERIRTIKKITETGRPFTTLFSTVVDIGRWVVLPEGKDRRTVVESWPGAVTWVLPATANVPAHLLAEDGTLGIRVPQSPLLRAVTAAMDELIISTSANFHGEPPATSRDSFSKELLDLVDGVVYETEPLSGKPSEVKRWTPAGLEIIRTRMSDTPRGGERIKILIVCTGNVCRSPLAEAILRDILKEKAPERFIIRSAGTMADSGQRASLQAVEVMREQGLDITAHRSRPVNRYLVEWADLVLAIGPDHLGDLHAAFPDLSGKMYLFTTFPEERVYGESGVSDPFGSDVEIYRKIAAEIRSHVERFVPHLLEMVQR